MRRIFCLNNFRSDIFVQLRVITHCILIVVQDHDVHPGIVPSVFRFLDRVRPQGVYQEPQQSSHEATPQRSHSVPRGQTPASLGLSVTRVQATQRMEFGPGHGCGVRLAPALVMLTVGHRGFHMSRFPRIRPTAKPSISKCSSGCTTIG